MELTTWADMDRYLDRTVVRPDAAAEYALKQSEAAGLPEIQVTAAQGKFLHLTAVAGKAKRALEIGTLGGYSAIWIAKALPADGRLVTLELEPLHAEVAQRTIANAGLTNKVDLRVGAALDLLPVLAQEDQPPFDLVFIDADKASLCAYFDWALALTAPGSVIIADNVVRGGAVLDPASDDPNVIGVQEFLQQVSTEDRVTATALQTVGSKGYDGFLFALVN
jgi:predicted O-methyltransferase YrrM